MAQNSANMSSRGLPSFDDRIDTTIIRALAILLVMNSHFEAFYPYSFLADGGMIGLILFFIASGSGVTGSPRIRREPFAKWMWLRAKRIYPQVFIVVVLFSLIPNQSWRTWRVVDYFKHFVYPTSYHFIGKIIVYYVVLYALAQIRDRRKHVVVQLLLLVLFSVFSWPDMRRLYVAPTPLMSGQLSPMLLWTFFLAVTLAGAALAEHPAWLRRPLNRWDAVGFVAMAGLYVVLKLLMSKYAVVPWLFPAYFAAATGLSLSLIRLLAHPSVLEHARRWPRGWRVTSLLSTISLEIYLVHAKMTLWNLWTLIPFPFNIIAFTLIAIILSYWVHKLASVLTSSRFQR